MKKLFFIALRLFSSLGNGELFSSLIISYGLKSSLPGAKRRGNPFLILIIILFTTFSFLPSKAAIEFDASDDYLEITNNNLNLTQFTFSTWVNHTLQNGSWDAFLRRGNSRSLYFSNNKLTWYNNLLWSTSTINTNTWYHTVVSYNGSTLKFWINGVEDASTSISTDFGTGYCRIGGDGIGGQSLNGKLDDVRIYNRALAPAEIEILYKSNKKRIGGSLANGLVAHYEMDGGEIGSVTSSVIDISGNSNHGVGNGGASLKYTEGVLRR